MLRTLYELSWSQFSLFQVTNGGNQLGFQLFFFSYSKLASEVRAVECTSVTNDLQSPTKPHKWMKKSGIV